MRRESSARFNARSRLSRRDSALIFRSRALLSANERVLRAYSYLEFFFESFVHFVVSLPNGGKTFTVK